MYSVMATMKLQRERLKSIEAKPEAVDDFDDVMEVSRSYHFSDKPRVLTLTLQEYFKKVKAQYPLIKLG